MEKIIKMIQSNDLIKMALVLLGVYLLMTYIKKDKKDKMDNVEHEIYEYLDNVNQNQPVFVQAPVQAPMQAPVQAPMQAPVQAPVQAPMQAPVQVQPAFTLDQYNVDNTQAQAPAKSLQQKHIDSIVDGKGQLHSDDLLPKYDEANEFAKQNPVSSLLKEQNFLISGYHVGINTVMQSNKIPYHDIRSVPPIPKENVSPWSQSSFETPMGSGRRMLEIGGI
jgi:hypothetical protein